MREREEQRSAGSEGQREIEGIGSQELRDRGVVTRTK